jgi:hypothetical protein
MTLQRLVLDYRSGDLVMRVLYRSEDGPNPGTKARTRGVAEWPGRGYRTRWRLSRAAPSV